MSADSWTERAASAPASPWLLSLYFTSLGLWVGAAVFFSSAVLPLLFLNLQPSQAGHIAALVFPTYFRAGSALGVVATATAFAISRGAGHLWRKAALLLLVMTLAELWSAAVLHPEMAATRGVVGKEERFQQLHVLSVRLNAIVLGGGLLLLAGSGWLLGSRRERGQLQ